ncbi:MAG: MBL fold metallo-hydrolase [Erysipelotrichaceae bacterium]|nr:MBL fold metallo-hydrolase [Erysipelotrichaceae bacterium]
MKTKIQFIEGLKGSGVVVSITYGNDRLLFDFGAPFRPDTQVYDGVILHRKQNALLDALRLGETPKVDGIYPKNDLCLFDGSVYENIVPSEDSTIKTAVLISHLHLDHMSNICYLDPSIPVYMHKNGKKLLTVLEDIQEGTPHERVVGIDYEVPFTHGPFTITPYFNDHPCFGSTSYYIDCPDMKIMYSGDIRFHGLSQEKAFAEIEKISHREIDLLIVDGTSYSPSEFVHDPNQIEELSKPSKDVLQGMFLEKHIYEDVVYRLKSSQSLGFFCTYHRDMQLIEALIEYLSKIDREIVFEVETAYVVQNVLHCPVKFYCSSHQQDSKILESVRINNVELSFADINNHANQYVVQVSYKNLMNLFSLNTQGGIYFHLFGDPFHKSGSRNLEKMLTMNEIEYVGYSNVYSFNHAFPNHLSWMLNTLQPKNVVCVHSRNPEKLNAMGANHVLPHQNEVYVYENNKLKCIGE